MVTTRLTPPKALSRLLTCMLLVAVAAGLTTTVHAQDDQEHKKVYNQAREAAQAKQINEAYDLFEEAATLAQQAGDDQVVQMSRKVLTQIDYRRGLALFKQESYDEALTHFEKGIEHGPDYASNYYGKGLVLKATDRFDEALPVFQQVMEMGERQHANAAENAIRGYYIAAASQALAGTNAGRSQAEEALQHLSALSELMEPDADTYYYMAAAEAVLGNDDRVIEYADQAIELHRGSRTDAAKMWFIKGEALMNRGDNEAAKQAFSNAVYGSYKAPAEHYIDTL